MLAPVLVIVLLAFRLPGPVTVCPFRLTFLALTLLVASIDSGASIARAAAVPAENATLLNVAPVPITSKVPAVVVRRWWLMMPGVPPVCEKFTPSKLIRPLALGFMVSELVTPMLPFRSSVFSCRRGNGQPRAKHDTGASAAIDCQRLWCSAYHRSPSVRFPQGRRSRKCCRSR